MSALLAPARPVRPRHFFFCSIPDTIMKDGLRISNCRPG
jgi:hypothetical protein